MTRITTAEVCALGRFSRATMWRRIKVGALPGPIDQARQALFDRDAVITALAVRRPRWRARSRPCDPIDASLGAPRVKPTRRWTAERWPVAS